jgi:hypothetical protein
MPWHCAHCHGRLAPGQDEDDRAAIWCCLLCGRETPTPAAVRARQAAWAAVRAEWEQRPQPGRYPRHCPGGRPRCLTPEQVAEIEARLADGQRVRAVAVACGVSRSTVGLIRAGRYWPREEAS